MAAMNLPAAGWFFLVTLLLSVSFGLLAIWVAVARERRWPIVFLVVALGLFLRIPAYEPLLFFAIQCGVIIIGSTLWRRTWSKDTYQSTSFSLGGLFGLLAIVAALLTVCIRVDLPSPSVWLNLVSGGTGCGIATLVGAWALVTPWRWRRLFVAIPALLVATLPMMFTDSLLLQFPSYEWRESLNGQLWIPTYFPYGPNSFVWGSMLFSIAITIFVLCWLWLGTNSESVRCRRLCRAAFFTALAVLFAGSLAVGFAVRAVPASQEEQIANNGYPLIREAIEEIGIAKPPPMKPQQEELSDAQMEVYLRQNSAVLAKFHEALSKPIQLPLEPFHSFGRGSPWGYVNTKMRRLLVCELDQLARQKRHAEVFDVSLQMLKFGKNVGEHGYMAYALAGRNLQSNALRYLTHLRHEADEAQLERMLSVLEQNDARLEPYDSALQRNGDCSALTWGWSSRLCQILPVNAEDNEKQRMMRLGWHRYEAIGRLLAIDTRIRQFEKEHGDLPPKLDVLDLPVHMLLDPYGNGSRVVYRKTESDFFLYSRGMNLKDDGGVVAKFNGSDADDGDWLLDEFFSRLLP